LDGIDGGGMSGILSGYFAPMVSIELRQSTAQGSNPKKSFLVLLDASDAGCGQPLFHVDVPNGEGLSPRNGRQENPQQQVQAKERDRHG